MTLNLAMHERLQDQADRINDLEADLEAKDAVISEQLKKIDDLRRKLAGEEYASRGLSKALEIAEQRLTDARQRIAAFEVSTAKKDDKIEDLQDKVTSLKAEIESRDSIIAEYQYQAAAVPGLRLDNKALQATLKKKLDEILDLEEKVGDLEDSKDELSRGLRETSKISQQRHDTIRNLSATNARLTRERDQLREEVAWFKAPRATVVGTSGKPTLTQAWKIENLQEDNKNLRAKIDRLRAEVERLRATNSTLRQENNTLQARSMDLEQEVHDAENAFYSQDDAASVHIHVR